MILSIILCTYHYIKLLKLFLHLISEGTTIEYYTTIIFASPLFTSVLSQPFFSCRTAFAFLVHVCSAPLSLSSNQFPDCFPTGRRHRKLSRTTKDRNGPRALLIIGVGHGSTHGLSSPPNTWLAKSENRDEKGEMMRIHLNRLIYWAKLISFMKWDTTLWNIRWECGRGGFGNWWSKSISFRFLGWWRWCKKNSYIMWVGLLYCQWYLLISAFIQTQQLGTYLPIFWCSIIFALSGPVRSQSYYSTICSDKITFTCKFTYLWKKKRRSGCLAF